MATKNIGPKFVSYFWPVRDGVPPIELVDGEKLVTMIEQLELGLNPIKSFKVDEAFFDQFK
ncbi:MAG: hypothetical protein ACT4OT_01330 [Acidobacteriota bacterium]